MFVAGGGGDRGPHSDFWYEPIWPRGGARATALTATAVPAVYGCVQVLGQTLGVPPLLLHRRKEDGGKVRATDHPLFKVLHRRPNRWQTSFQWRQMLQWHLGLRGRAYCEIFYGARGEVRELVPLHPDRTGVEETDAGYRYWNIDRKGIKRYLVRGEVLHLRGLVTDGIEGLSPIEAQGESIGEALEAQRYSSKVLANDARPLGLIEMAGHFKDKAAKDEFKTSWQEAQGGMNRGRVAVLEHGMSWKDIGIKSADLQLIELRKMKGYDVCTAYRMPPHKIGLMERATFTNIEHQGIEFVTDTMMPWFVNWEQDIAAQLLTEDEAEELFVEFLAEGLLRGDSAGRSNYYGKMFQTGAMSPNDIRVAENQDKVEGGDRRFVPANMMPLDRVDDMVERGAIQRGGEKREEGGEREEKDDRARALARSASERILRKEVAALARIRAQHGADRAAFLRDASTFYGQHQAFVAEVMAVSDAVASEYCLAQFEALAGNGDARTASELESVLQGTWHWR